MQAAGEGRTRDGLTELKAFVAGRFPHVFLILVVALMAPLLARGIQRESPTEDEWAHLVRGINYWQNKDMRVHVQHPPLANAIAALPSAFDDNPDLTQMKTWRDGYSPGLEYIKTDYERARKQLAKGRYMAMLFQVGLVVYLFYFCRSVFGWPTAAATALLVAFNPTLLGQARYVATDMPAATMATIAAGELARYISQPRRLFTFALALAGLVLSKHSGIIFVIFMSGVALLAAVLKSGHFANENSVWRRLGRCFLHLSIAGVVVLFAVNAVYKFDRTGMTVREILDAPEPKHWTTNRYKGQLLEERSPLPRLPDEVRLPIPYPYLVGVFGVREQDRMGYPAYFMGKSSRLGRWEYFPVLLALKDPPGLLLLLGLGAVLFVRRYRRSSSAAAVPVVEGPASSAEPLAPFEVPAERSSPPSSRPSSPPSSRPSSLASSRPSSGPSQTMLGLSIPSACFLLISAVFLAFIMRSNLNMGVRHALPVIPMASVLGARAFARAGELLSGNWLDAVRVLGLTGILSALISGPHYLNYYNFLALGQGSFINVAGEDWGQDRQEFVRFAKSKGLSPLYYHTQTSTRKLEVEYLGLEFKDLGCKTRPKPGSWVAIHAQYVHRFESGNCAVWMRGLSPEYKVNDNIWIYKIPAPPEG